VLVSGNDFYSSLRLSPDGSRLAWLVNEGGNLEGDDYLFTSSTAKPREHQVASAPRLIVVLPCDASVAFVKCNRVGNR